METMEEDSLNQDICRVCRCEATPARPLFHPCICTGSIKFIHQDCLVQWLRYSRKEYCELCKHRFHFTPIYSPDMPKRLPIADIVAGLARSIGTAIRYWLHYTLVAVAWLGVVPLTACRIYRCLFTGSVSSVLTLPLDMLSTENLLADIFHGSFVVACTLSAFISLVWLREQILHGGGPDWLDPDLQDVQGEDGAGNGVGDIGNGIAVPAVVNFPNVEEQNDPAADPPPANLADDGGDEGGGAGGAVGGDDGNWNPMEWDRAAEELTWERLLGLDGSLVFLEHVFWVVSLNTMFILVFAFCPYHIGHFAIVGLRLKHWVAASHFEGLLTTLCGYCIVGVGLVVMHGTAMIVRLNKSKRILGLCYVVIKVALLSVVEIGVFPLIGGWWLDICSLSLFDSNLKDREASFKAAAGTSMFIHWLVGMVYVFYFASFILLLREVLRPGVLWFLRNLNDPDFNPVQEMIHLPILRHTRRFLASLVIFGSTVLLMLWLPIRVIQWVWPSFLPYHISLSSDTIVSELSLELLLLQVILPALLEQGHTRVWLKGLVRQWCVAVSHILSLRSYLLGDVPLESEVGEVIIGGENVLAGMAGANEGIGEAGDAVPAPVGVQGEGGDNAGEENAHEEGDDFGGGLGAVHQALLQRDGPIGFQAYVRPGWFGARIVGLIAIMCVSLSISSVICLTVPVFLGRQCMFLLLGDTKVHELYTGACGLYVSLLGIRAVTVASSWLVVGWGEVMQRLKHWLMVGIKAVIAFCMVAVTVPLMVGLLMELVIVLPIRVPIHQTPIHFMWQDWALGVLYTKILCAIVMMGPNWWLKNNLEQIYQAGIRGLDMHLLLRGIALPVMGALGLCLAVPFVVARSLAPLVTPENALVLVERRIYPTLLVASVLSTIVVMQVIQFSRLYEHIKNDKYLVGRRLVNYDHLNASQLWAIPERESTPQR